MKDDEDHIVYLNANLYNQIFLAAYRDYTNYWMDLMDCRNENEVYSINYVYQDDVMYLPKNYH